MISRKIKFNITSLLFILIAGLFFTVIILKPSWQIGGDGFGYYSYIRSFLFDGDFVLQNEFALFDSLYEHTTLQGWQTPVGQIGNPFAIGAAILWSPFVIVAKALTSIWQFNDQYSLAGFNPPFQIAIVLGTWFYFLSGIVLIFKTLNKLINKKYTWLGILAAITLSPAPFYLIYEPSMAHGLTVFTTAWLFYLSINIHKSSDFKLKDFILLGLSLGLMFLVRWQDILFAIVPATIIFYKVYKQKKVEIKLIITALLFFIISIIPQLLMWRHLFGSWLTVPQGASFFQLSNPHIFDFLFSSYHGMLVIHPLLLFIVLGLFFAYKKEKFLTIILITSLLLQVYMNSALYDWFGGGSFGARRMLSSLFIFIFAWAFLFDGIKKKLIWIIMIILVFTGIIFNGLLMMSYAKGVIPLNEYISYNEVYKAPIKILLSL